LNARRSNVGITDAVVARTLDQSAVSLAAGRPRRAPTDPAIRLLIVEMHTIFRLGLVSLFTTARHCEVVGEASTAEEAVERARLTSPDVVLMDADLPASSVILACQQIRAENEHIYVILLTSVADQSVLVSGIHAGVRGYLNKRSEPERIVEAVEIVAADGVYFPPQVVTALVEWFRAGQPDSDPFGRVSQQERRILRLIAAGKTNRDIAAALGLSEYTVKTYVSAALRKLGLTSRAQAAAFMVRYDDQA
jgi:DNA-binding NarL/FixJ family response regulator